MTTGTTNSILPSAAGRILERAEIEAIIPHSGSMSLIDRVEFWDEQMIHCTATSHRNADNPLRHEGRLSSIHLIEYGAQAIAIHSALLHTPVSAGILAAVRHVDLKIDSLDGIEQNLNICARAEAILDNAALYALSVEQDNGSRLMTATATVAGR